MDVGISFVANFQASKAMEPGNRAFYDPTCFAKSAAMRRAELGEQGRDTTLAQALTMRLRTVSPVALDDFRLAQRPAAPAADGRNCLDQCIKPGHVVAVRTGQDDRERDALRIDDEVVLAAELAPVRWVRTGFFPAAMARIEELSTMAHAMSSRPRRRNSAHSVSWIRCQTPAFCQATNRRQQAVPEPQPISWGSRFHAMPERSINTMPVSTARSGVGLRPAYRRLRDARTGSNGSISDHSSSSMSSLGIASCRTTQDRKLTSAGKS